MSKLVTIIIPSYCPDGTVKGYEARCLKAVADNTPREMYELILMGGGDWSYPKKVNAAMSRVETPYVVILSNDVFVGHGWLTNMLRVYRSIPNLGILSPQDQNYPAIGGSYGDIHWDEHWWALVLFAREIYEQLGGLDETLPLVYHDQNFSIQLKKRGFHIARTKEVFVEHVGMATRSRIGTTDDEAEKAEMINRYGACDLAGWLELQNPKPAWWDK